MSREVVLYTPATGFPDLEAKIAYGLARAGVEAFGIENVEIEPFAGIYQVKIKGDISKLQASFNILSKRILSSSYIARNTPGITGRSADKLIFEESDILNLDLYSAYPPVIINNEKREPVCHHVGKKINKVSNVIGLSASTSYYHERDYVNVQQDRYGIHRPTNPKEICKNCVSVALLGIWFTTFIFFLKEQEVFITPLPTEKINGEKLINLFSIQHQVRNIWLNQEIPQSLIPLIFLSKIPSSSEILRGFNLFVVVLSRQQGYHVDALSFIPVDRYIDYLNNNPFNIAAIDTMVSRGAFRALSVLNHSIFYERGNELEKFGRLYVQETSTDNWINLIYLETAKYLLKEVAMIKPQIIENKAINSLAHTLRYFVREKKYHYADDLRNARRDSKEFEETLTKMLREGRLRLEQEKRIHLPNEEEIKEVFKLCESSFDEVKTAIVLLGLSFPSKGEEKIEEEVSNA